jgi:nitrogen regulatory protein PII
MRLITIIIEALARTAVERLLAEVGAHGFTVFPVEGSGAHGRRTGDMAEFGNLQFEVVAAPAVADGLLERLGREFSPRYAMVVYETEVAVLRREKFA